MRIATSSVRSIRKRLPAVLHWLADRKPDIVALQKIAVYPKSRSQPGRWRESATTAYGATARSSGTDFGVAVLSRRELPKPEIRCPRACPVPGTVSGARLLTVDIGQIRFSSIYAPYGNPRKYGNEQAIERRVAWLRCLAGPTSVKQGYAGAAKPAMRGLQRHPRRSPPRRGAAPTASGSRHELTRLCELGFVDLYRRAHPAGKAGFNFGFQCSPRKVPRGFT